MRHAFLGSLLGSAQAGYWGADAGAGDEDVLVVRNGDLKPEGVRWSVLPLRSFSADQARKSRVREGDLLLTTSGDCGVVAAVEHEPEVTTCASNFIRVLRPDKQLVHPRYLYHYMRTRRFRDDLQPYIRGTTMQNLSTKQAFDAVAVPLPDARTQAHTAELLDAADRLRSLRQASLTTYSGLAPALYAELLAGASPDWTPLALGDLVVDTQLGLDRSAKAQSLEYPFAYAKMNVITRDGRLDLSHLVRVQASESELAKYSLRDGDLIFNTRNTRELVGKSAVFRGSPVLFNNNIMRLRFDRRVVPEYVHAYLWSEEGKRQLDARKAGTTSVFAVYAKNLLTVRLPVPPLVIQEEFAAKLASVEAQGARMQAHAEELDGLFASLQHSAFPRGALPEALAPNPGAERR